MSAQPAKVVCPNCNNANEYGDYEGPTCEVCKGYGYVMPYVYFWNRQSRKGMPCEVIKGADERPKRHGWAPGSYSCICHDCKKHFIGDKRAILCAPCAYLRPDK